MQGKDCPQCTERVPEQASTCRYCQHAFMNAAPIYEFKPFLVEADQFGTFIKKGRFLTQKINMSPEKIVITTPGFMGLSQAEEEIPWKKIAGYNFHSGIMWDSIIIETRGQTANVISPLSKENSQHLREILTKMKN